MDASASAVSPTGPSFVQLDGALVVHSDTPHGAHSPLPPPPSPPHLRRRQVRRVRLVRAALHAGAHLRRVQLRLVPGALRHLRRAGRVRRLLLQGVHHRGERCALPRWWWWRVDASRQSRSLLRFLRAWPPTTVTRALRKEAGGKEERRREGPNGRNAGVCVYDRVNRGKGRLPPRLHAAASPSHPHPHLSPPPPQRDGCPKIVNLGAAKTDLFYERKKYGFKPR